MRFLLVGDIVGKTGMEKVTSELPKIVKDKNIDFCIANGENSANGKGLRMIEYNKLLSIGVDAITMGNHIYYRKEMASEYIKLNKLLIPANVTNLIGNGSLIFSKNNVKIGVINIIGKTFMGEIFEKNTTDPFKVVLEHIESLKKENANYIFVDFHAEVTAEKIAMGHFLSDKGVTCVFGTHTHVQTADEEIINGMGYITDLGMTGPKQSVLGLKKEIALKRFVTGAYAKYECSTNEAMLNGMIVETDDITHKVSYLERLYIK